MNSALTKLEHVKCPLPRGGKCAKVLKQMNNKLDNKATYDKKFSTRRRRRLNKTKWLGYNFFKINIRRLLNSGWITGSETKFDSILSFNTYCIRIFLYMHVHVCNNYMFSLNFHVQGTSDFINSFKWGNKEPGFEPWCNSSHTCCMIILNVKFENEPFSTFWELAVTIFKYQNPIAHLVTWSVPKCNMHN